MREIRKKDVLPKAKDWKDQGKKWHFHLLSPNCIFNEKNDNDALILENSTDDQSYVLYTKQRQLKLGKTLIRLLHGNDILQNNKKIRQPQTEQFIKIVKRAEQMNKCGTPWHHHVFFPDCKYNDHVGQWNIVMEDSKQGSLLEAVYNLEPEDDLKIIEQLFYKQKK